MFYKDSHCGYCVDEHSPTHRYRKKGYDGRFVIQERTFITGTGYSEEDDYWAYQDLRHGKWDYATLEEARTALKEYRRARKETSKSI